MPRKFKDIIKLIEKDGWYLAAQVVATDNTNTLSSAAA